MSKLMSREVVLLGGPADGRIVVSDCARYRVKTTRGDGQTWAALYSLSILDTPPEGPLVFKHQGWSLVASPEPDPPHHHHGEEDSRDEDHEGDPGRPA